MTHARPHREVYTQTGTGESPGQFTRPVQRLIQRPYHKASAKPARWWRRRRGYLSV